MRHKLICTLLVAGTGTFAYHQYRQVKLGRRVRRARRAATGARMDVVVIAGSPALPLTRALALDLELKGYVVFVVCGVLEEESMLRDMARPDIRPLSLDILEVCIHVFGPFPWQKLLLIRLLCAACFIWRRY